MKKIQSGCIQTILDDNGRLLHYKSTLPIPKEVALLDSASYQYIKGKWYYMITDVDYDSLWYRMNLVRIKVGKYKATLILKKMDSILRSNVDYIVNNLK